MLNFSVPEDLPIKVHPCKVCGRMPWMRINITPCGGWYRLRCKPLFRKPHASVEVGCANPERAKYLAIRYWNEEQNGK